MQEYFITVEIKDKNNEKGFLYTFPLLFFKFRIEKQYLSKKKRGKIISKIIYEKAKDRLMLLPIDNILDYFENHIDIIIHELKEIDYKEIIIS